MKNRINEAANAAVFANILEYDGDMEANYVEGAPHVKHEALRALYAQRLQDAFNTVASEGGLLRVLDLGAGEGSVTRPMLELGANVTAVDVSKSQLEALKARCAGFSANLTLVCEDIHSYLSTVDTRFDIITAHSFLHHVPDYLSLLEKVPGLLTPKGVFFSFQDPLKYSRMKRSEKAFSDLAYFIWRVGRPDVWGGIRRHLRRRRGVYLDDSHHDNAEYHVVREGVDQERIRELFEGRGFSCEIATYFSTQSALFQRIGAFLKARNTFSVLAKRTGERETAHSSSEKA